MNRQIGADAPDDCVALGTGKALESPAILQNYNSADQREL